MQDGGPFGIIEAAIVEQHVGRPQQPACADAAAPAPFAADFKQIGEVVIEQQRQFKAGAAVAMVLHADALIGGTAPEEDRAHDVQQILLQHEAALAVDVRVGEIDRQGRIVVAQIGAEQQRLKVVEHELQPREVAGVVMEQAVRSAGRRADVTMTVEHDEGVVVLERATRSRRRARHRDIEGLLRDLFHGPRHRDALGDDFSCHKVLPCVLFRSATDANTTVGFTLRIWRAGSSPA